MEDALPSPELPRIPADTAPEQEWGKTPADTEERKFLEGPHDRSSELLRAFRIFREYIKGFRALHFVGPCVTVFGSARFEPAIRYYALTRESGRRARRGGLHRHDRRRPGADGGGEPRRARGGRPLDRLQHHRFPPSRSPIRTSMLGRVPLLLRPQADARQVFVRVHRVPGGYGTLDELFEVAALIQTGKITDFPFVLIGADYWRPLVGFCATRWCGRHHRRRRRRPAHRHRLARRGDCDHPRGSDPEVRAALREEARSAARLVVRIEGLRTQLRGSLSWRVRKFHDGA